LHILFSVYLVSVVENKEPQCHPCESRGPERKNWIPACAGMTNTASATETNYVLDQPDRDRTYYWRVDEVEADGTTIREGGYWNISSFDRGSDCAPKLEITYVLPPEKPGSSEPAREIADTKG